MCPEVVVVLEPAKQIIVTGMGPQGPMGTVEGSVGELEIIGDLSVGDDTTLDGDLSVGGAVDLNSTLNVDGNATFGGTITTDGGVVTALGWYNVKDYGAISGVSSTAAIQAAIDAIPTIGGVLYFPAGSWLCSGELDFETRRNIVVRGNGGTSGGAQTASLLYTDQTGSGSFLNLKDAVGIQFHDMEIGYTSASFTGRLIDCRETSAVNSYCAFTNCLITGLAVSTATLIDLDGAIFFTADQCVFGGANIHIYGLSSGNFSNGIRLRDCVFNHATTVSIRNPGGGWLISGCGFEGTGASAAHAIDHEAGVLCQGLEISGCWAGDTTGGTTFKVAGNGITIQGSYLGATSGTSIHLDELSEGVHISGNEFDTSVNCINYGSLAHKGVVEHSNAYRSVTNHRINAGSLPVGTMIQDNTGATTFTGLAVTGDLAVTGHTTTGELTVNNQIRLETDNATLFVMDPTAGFGRDILARHIKTFAGNIQMLAAGDGLVIKEGTNATMGPATLVGGTVTINTTKVGANTRIFYNVITAGGTQGFLRVSARVNGTSFTITSTSGTETSTISWLLIEPAP